MRPKILLPGLRDDRRSFRKIKTICNSQYLAHDPRNRVAIPRHFATEQKRRLTGIVYSTILQLIQPCSVGPGRFSYPIILNTRSPHDRRPENSLKSGKCILIASWQKDTCTTWRSPTIHLHERSHHKAAELNSVIFATQRRFDVF